MYTQKSLDLLTKEDLKDLSCKMEISFSNSAKKPALVEGILKFMENGENAYEHMYRLLKLNFPSHPLLLHINYEPKNLNILEHGDLLKLKVADLKGILKYYDKISDEVLLGGNKTEIIERIQDILNCCTKLGSLVLKACVRNHINYQKFHNPNFNGEIFEKLIMTDMYADKSIERLNEKIDEYLEKIDRANEKIDKYNKKIQKREIEIDELKNCEKISLSDGPGIVENSETDNAGFVYLLHHKNDTKIGLSKYKTEETLRNALYKRYHTSLGFTKLDDSNFQCKKYNDVKQAEKLMHVKYSKIRVNNSEWFSIHINDIEWV